MPAAAQIVNIRMHDHGAPQDRILSTQRYHRVGEVELGCAATGRHIAEIPGVPLALPVSGGAVRTAVRVEVRPSAGAAIGVISELNRLTGSSGVVLLAVPVKSHW